jgi:hypothetical protein
MIAVTRRVLSFIFICAAVTNIGAAQAQSPGAIPNSPAAAAPASGHAAAQPFDVSAAVEAYLAKMSPAQRARSNAYFEGGYWLQLWDFLSTVLVRTAGVPLTRFSITSRMTIWSHEDGIRETAVRCRRFPARTPSRS